MADGGHNDTVLSSATLTQLCVSEAELFLCLSGVEERQVGDDHDDGTSVFAIQQLQE